MGVADYIRDRWPESAEYAERFENAYSPHCSLPSQLLFQLIDQLRNPVSLFGPLRPQPFYQTPEQVFFQDIEFLLPFVDFSL